MFPQGGGRAPCSAQTLTWGLDHSQERWKAKVRTAQCRAPVRHGVWQDQSLPWVFPTAVPTSSWQLQSAGPVTPRLVVCRVGGSPALAAMCWGRMPRESHSPARAKPGDFWAVLHAFPCAGAVGSQRDSAGCSPASAPGCSPRAPQPAAIPDPSLSALPARC